MAGTVIALKSALAHVEQAASNARGPIATAKRIVEGVGRLVGEALGHDSQVGREALGHLASAIEHLDSAVAQMAMAAYKLRGGIARAGQL